jgi:hypothetical protein
MPSIKPTPTRDARGRGRRGVRRRAAAHRRLPRRRWLLLGGDDLVEIHEGLWGDPNQTMRRIRFYQRFANTIEDLDKITVAMAEGFVLGGGVAQDDSVDVDDLRNFVAERVADFKVPAEFNFVEEIPRTGSGKIMRHRLREGLVRLSSPG